MEIARVTPSRTLERKFRREVAGARLCSSPPEGGVVREEDLASLPPVVRRYLDFMRVAGRPRTWSFRMHAVGGFRFGPDRPFIPCEAWQVDSRAPIARIFHMRLKLASLVPVFVRDTYIRGHGHMSGRILDALSIVDATDEKISTGELVTYLNDAILFAPSMLLGPETIWSDATAHSFDVALTDGGRTVRARVFVDDAGAPIDFETTDRYGVDPAGTKEMIRARWSTPIDGFTTARGRPVPIGGKATWHFASGDFTYADFRFCHADVAFDVHPGIP